MHKKAVEESIQRNYPNASEESKNAMRLLEGIDITEDEKRKIDEMRMTLGQCFEDIKEALSIYLDIPENYKTIIALWIIGTYYHDEFETYPYLFLNAMRSSGKTRAIKLITTLAKDGQLLASITESVLFRCVGTLGIDEFEGVGGKEKQALRELLNAGYKKGITIRRMKKVKRRAEDGSVGEGQEAESFDAYRPVVMANIWGMDEVVADRCITLILEKSNKVIFTKRIEDFSTNQFLVRIKQTLHTLTTQTDTKSVYECRLCRLVQSKEYIEKWNSYLNQKYDTQTYIQTLQTQTDTNIHTLLSDDLFFKKIDETNIDGRHLELLFPFFLIARTLNDEILEETLKIATELVTSKKDDEVMESKDVMLLDFISRLNYDGSWIAIQELTNKFKDFVGERDAKDDWLSTEWVGKALKRLSLVSEKRRLGRGIDVVINKSKADEKLKIFR